MRIKKLCSRVWIKVYYTFWNIINRISLNVNCVQIDKNVRINGGVRISSSTFGKIRIGKGTTINVNGRIRVPFYSLQVMP